MSEKEKKSSSKFPQINATLEEMKVWVGKWLRVNFMHMPSEACDPFIRYEWDPCADWNAEWVWDEEQQKKVKPDPRPEALSHEVLLHGRYGGNSRPDTTYPMRGATELEAWSWFIAVELLFRPENPHQFDEAVKTLAAIHDLNYKAYKVNLTSVLTPEDPGHLQEWTEDTLRKREIEAWRMVWTTTIIDAGLMEIETLPEPIDYGVRAREEEKKRREEQE